MAGIETVGSYEWWPTATKTHALNFGGQIELTDIRRLNAALLPRVDVVVGSPPCTQFSFANRGGSGDLDDGLRDIEKFLSIVRAIAPRFWVMENVPRVASILERELKPAGRLHRYADLVTVIMVVDTANYGLPQSRKRMLAGNFPSELFASYTSALPRRSLGQVVEALAANPVIDPVYGVKLPRNLLTGQEPEPVLTAEESRMNREAKQFHPVYNRMNFPDDLLKPARTVTATCTRVSRESIVVPASDGATRRLTVRERASLQGFPITFQFYGDSHSDNLKMVGNAIPPLLTYYVAQSMLGTLPARLASPKPDKKLPPQLPTATDLTVRVRYSADRRFRSAIPNLRFGSGVRFEFANHVAETGCSWRVEFFFGTSKNILSAQPDSRFLKAYKRAGAGPQEVIASLGDELGVFLEQASGSDLQRVWTRKQQGRHPFEVVDELGRYADAIHRAIEPSSTQVENFVDNYLRRVAGTGLSTPKLRKSASWVLSGLILGAFVNRSEIARVPRKLRLAG